MLQTVAHGHGVRLPLVAGCGQPAQQGDLIKEVGLSGDSTELYLHMELEHDGYAEVRPSVFTAPKACSDRHNLPPEYAQIGGDHGQDIDQLP